MIKPADIDDISWEVLTAANSGDVAAMRRLLADDPDRSRNGYFYTPPFILPFAKDTLKLCECCSTPARTRNGTATMAPA